MKLNKRKVALSMIIPFLTVFVVIFLFLCSDSSLWSEIQRQFFEIFIASSVLWIPSIIICLVLEATMLKSSVEKKKLRNLLMIETVIASALSLHLFLVILVLGTVGNIMRYQWLIYKDRVYH